MSDSKPSGETLLAASLTFGVLGKALYRELDNEELDQLLKTRVFTEIPFGEGQADSQKGIKELSDWTEENADGLSQDSCNDIRHDFLYLFVGVGRPLAAPWESTYCNESRTMFEKQTLQVRDWYKEYGLMIGRKNKEPDDQIGYELSFIAHVAHVASEASKSGDRVELEDLLDAIRDFLCQHLLRWAFIWSTRVQKNARSNFYKGLALLVSGSLQALSLELGIKAQDVKQCTS
jgi:TorA maturation chaperone TorD